MLYYHYPCYTLPAMSLFYDDESGKPPIKTPEQILLETKNIIKKYGYSSSTKLCRKR